MKHAWLVVLVFLMGCVQTTVTSISDPTIGGKKYNNIMVLTDAMNLEDAKAAERGMSTALTKKGRYNGTSLALMPPVRVYSSEEWQNVIAQNEFQGMLYLVGGAKGTNTAYIPGQYVPQRTTGTVTTFGNTATVNATTTGGHYTPGYTVRKPTSTFSAILIDIDTGNVVWRADLSAAGGIQYGYDDLAYAAGVRAVQQLEKDGLIVSVPK